MHVLAARSLGVGTVGSDYHSSSRLLHHPPSAAVAMIPGGTGRVTATRTRVEVTPEAFAGWATSGSPPATETYEKVDSKRGGGEGGEKSAWSHLGERPHATRAPNSSSSHPTGRHLAVMAAASRVRDAAAAAADTVIHAAGPGPEEEAIEVVQGVHERGGGAEPAEPGAHSVPPVDRRDLTIAQPASMSRKDQQVRSVELLQEWRCNVRNSIVRSVGHTRGGVRRKDDLDVPANQNGGGLARVMMRDGVTESAKSASGPVTRKNDHDSHQKLREKSSRNGKSLHINFSSCSINDSHRSSHGSRRTANSSTSSSSSQRIPSHLSTELHSHSRRSDARNNNSSTASMRDGRGQIGPASSAATSPRGRAADRSDEVHHSRRTEHAASREHHHRHHRHEHQDHLAGRARARFFGMGGGGGAPKPQQQPQQRQQHWNRQRQEQPPKRQWKSAVDPKSGRTYYYDAVTRETQWRKPAELATDEERRALREKERKQKEFFASMEANILRSIAGGNLAPGSPTRGGGEEEEESREGVGEMKSSGGSGSLSAASAAAASDAGAKKTKLATLLPKGLKPAGRPVRTISSMDDALLAELAKTGDNKTKSSPDGVSNFPFPPVGGNGSKNSLTSSDDSGPNNAAAGDVTPLAAHLHASFPPPSGNGGRGAQAEPSSEDRALAEVRRTADEIAALTPPRSGSSSAVATPSPSAPQGCSEPVSVPTPSELKKLPRPILQQRNTCGTLYVSSTMADPDRDATIRCVCGVYRAHMLQAARDEASSGFGPTVRFDEYEIFNDLPSQRGRGLGGEISINPPVAAAAEGGGAARVVAASGTLARQARSFDDARDDPAGGSLVPPPSSSGGDDDDGDDNVVVSSNTSGGAEDLSIEALSLESIEGAVPSLETITNFYRDVFRRSQMEPDCIIMSLIYIERLIKVTNGGVRPRIGNWRSVLFAAMVMSSKVWDDLSMWNADFSQTCPSGVRFPLQRINELELAMLNCLKFNVKVPASEYAKYYFLLRSMCIRSGLAGQDLMNMSPLDVEGARRLEHLSTAFQGAVGGKQGGELAKPGKLGASRRSKSTGEVERTSSPASATPGSGGRAGATSPTGTTKVSLEQVVQM